jgi:hypothetical protein
LLRTGAGKRREGKAVTINGYAVSFGVMKMF